MSPRPKTASDEVILEAAARLLARLGPARLRLEDVAREVGLAPATLLLRFKSKRNLLLAVVQHGTACMREHFQLRRSAGGSALHAVTEVCDHVREITEEPQQLANLFAFIQLSLEDPEFRQHAERHDTTLEQEMTHLLDEALARGELRETDTRALARAVIAIVRGSLFTWSALGQHTTADQWVRNDLETLLVHYRTEASARPVAKPPHATTASRPTARRRARPATRAHS